MLLWRSSLVYLREGQPSLSSHQVQRSRTPSPTMLFTSRQQAVKRSLTQRPTAPDQWQANGERSRSWCPWKQPGFCFYSCREVLFTESRNVSAKGAFIMCCAYLRSNRKLIMTDSKQKDANSQQMAEACMDNEIRFN